MYGLEVVVKDCWRDLIVKKLSFIIWGGCGRSVFCEWAAGEHTFFLSFSETQVKFDSVKKQMESMEMEIMEARLLRASELNGEMDNDGDDDSGKKQNNKLDDQSDEADV